MCRCAFARRANRREPFWHRQHEGSLWAMERTGLAVYSLPEIRRSPAQFAECCDCFANHFKIRVFCQRTDLIARCRVADIADHSRHSSAHLWIRATQVPIQFAEPAIELSELVEIDLSLLALPAVNGICEVVDVVELAR